MRVLVFPCSSGVGQEIFYALSQQKHIELFGLNQGDVLDSVGGFLYKDGFIGGAPSMSDCDAFIEFLNTVVAKHEIDAVFPAYDDAQVFLQEHAHRLPSRVAIVTSPLETVKTCRSKSATYASLQHAIRVPAMYGKPSEYPCAPLPYPVFIKPDDGEGSKGCHLIRNDDELKAHWTPKHIVVEYLPGQEFTVDCLTNAWGELVFSRARIRKLVRAGISILSCSLDNEAEVEGEIRHMAAGINATMRLVGAWFFQCKLDAQGRVALLEVAPRIAGAMATYRCVGVNFPLLSLECHMGRDVRVLPQASTLRTSLAKVYENHARIAFPTRIEHVYCDLDDTLILKGGVVNGRMIAFLYECRNKNKQLYLITRHRNDVAQTLQAHDISLSIFNGGIIHIRDQNSPKSIYIKPHSILIDDSFREREDATHNVQNCWAFDVDAVSNLEII